MSALFAVAVYVLFSLGAIAMIYTIIHESEAVLR